ILLLFTIPSTTNIYTLSLHDALPICTTADTLVDRLHITAAGSIGIGTANPLASSMLDIEGNTLGNAAFVVNNTGGSGDLFTASRSEEHTSELQSLAYLVCRLLLEKKK